MYILRAMLSLELMEVKKQIQTAQPMRFFRRLSRPKAN
jgi:hypothetical protein